MARRLRDRNLESREARRKLKVSGKPYWRGIGRGLHLGYRKNKVGGVWVIRRYLGKQQYHLHTIAEADDHLDANGQEILDFWQAQEAARNMRVTDVAKLAFTVRDAVKLYCAHLEGRASGNDTKKRLEAFALPRFGELPVASLQTDDLRSWHKSLAKMQARRRSKAGTVEHRADDLSDPEVQRKRQVSANRILKLFKAALNHAWTEGKIKCSKEAWERVLPFKGVDVSRAKYLSTAEAQRLINASEGDFRVLVQAALYTGARYGELGRLQVADFNRDVGTLHIRKSKVGKDRHIALTDEGKAFFEQLAIGRAGTDLLLGREWGKSRQADLIKEACVRAGIEPLNFHQLRHTWASLCIMNGMPLFVVAKNFGHANTQMVEKHYGHLEQGYVASEIRTKAPVFGQVASNVRALR